MLNVAEIDQEQAENRAEDERVWAQEEEEEEQREWERGEAEARHWRRQISQYNADRAANANAVAAANANAVAAAQVPVDTPAPAGHAPMSFNAIRLAKSDYVTAEGRHKIGRGLGYSSLIKPGERLGMFTGDFMTRVDFNLRPSCFGVGLDEENVLQCELYAQHWTAIP
ncbi:hypothetical protein B484DRAFT_411738 [Ochromonadaceae sp. CCMP2298]|nr:hypothetical protein B484DRAFT_411738 [Ochromonadaceae sp. CCMP2298]